MKVGGIEEPRGNVLGRRGFNSTDFGVGLPNRPSGEMHEETWDQAFDSCCVVTDARGGSRRQRRLRRARQRSAAAGQEEKEIRSPSGYRADRFRRRISR